MNLPPPRPRTGHRYLDATGSARPGAPGDRVLAIAHRGGAGHPDLAGLENTVEAFRHAVAQGYRYVETDVHASADGVLFAFHDDDLVRMAGRSEAIADLTAAQLSEVLVGGLHGVPTMAALLEEFPTCRFNIDLKSGPAVAPLADLVRRTGCWDRVCVGSFSAARIADFRRRTGGRVATAAAPAEVAAFRFLPTRRLAARAVRALAGGPDVLQVPRRRGPVAVVTAGLVRRAHRSGLHVHVWTVDDRAEIIELLDLGVDGIISDRTDVLRDVLVRRGLWEGGNG